jgi:hypothetical protein
MQPIPATHEILSFNEFRPFSETFIETGSGHGDGIQRALDAGFEHVASIEAYYENFLVCARRFAGDSTVHLYFGRSVDVLPGLLQLHPYPCVFFLDAHPSAENSYGYLEAAHGEDAYFQDTIIRAELALILASPQRHVILIDDMHGRSAECLPDYLEMIQRAKPGYAFRLYDENLSPDADPAYFYEDKLLAAVPEGL